MRFYIKSICWLVIVICICLGIAFSQENNRISTKIIIPECDGKHVLNTDISIDIQTVLYREGYLQCVNDKLMTALEDARDFVPSPSESTGTITLQLNDGLYHPPLSRSELLRKEAKEKIEQADRLEILEKKAAEFNRIYDSIFIAVSYPTDSGGWPTQKKMEKLIETTKKAGKP